VAGDIDWVKVDLTAGATYAFSLQGVDAGQDTLADPYLWLQDGEGHRLAWDDDVGTGTGTYKLSANQGDDYAGNTSTTGTLTSSSAINGELETVGEREWFKVSLVAGNYYCFDLQGAASGVGTLTDPYLFFYNSAGSLLASDDDSGNGCESRLTYSAASTGTYRLTAWDPPITEEPSGLSTALETTLAQVSNAGGASAVDTLLAAATGAGGAGAASGPASDPAPSAPGLATGATAPAADPAPATPTAGSLALAAPSDIATPSLTAPSGAGTAPTLAAAS
jgi:hypothetical protein